MQHAGFKLEPAGFFDENPALDVPPPEGHCHRDARGPRTPESAPGRLEAGR